jgi:thiol:disulfide interchange protein
MKHFLPALAASLIIAFVLPARAAAPIYPEVARAASDIAAAQKEAARTHRRVLVDFGGNWCTDCKVLDINMRKPENAALLAERYVVVHVNVGDKGIDANFDVARRYGIPLEKGVPALAVLDDSGRVVYAQRTGEFEDMRHMDPASVHAFLEKWAR